MNSTTTARELFTQLLTEIDATDPEMLTPKFPLEKGDKVTGTISDEFTKKVFSLSSFYRREGRRLQVDVESTGENQEASLELQKYKQKHEMLQEIFWWLVRTQFDHWGGNCGIRKDWQVVRTPDSDEKATIIKANLPKFLRDLLDE
jgi:hypothetical protein